MAKSRNAFLIIKKAKKINWWLTLNLICITIVSLVSIYSATITKGNFFIKREILWVFISLIAYFICMFIDYKKYLKYRNVLYVVNILMLLSVFVLGDARMGARRWITFGTVNIQPSEFSKLIVVLTLAAFLSNNYSEKFKGFFSICVSFLHIFPVFLLITIQPDLGTALVLIVIYFTLIFINQIDMLTLSVLLVSGILAVPIAYFTLLKDYQKVRVLTFLNPASDVLGSGWNVTQSMIAIGSGRIYGKGFLNSTQSKLKFLPESHTDFIGAVYLEERGFLGGIVLIVLYMWLLYQIISIADSTRDRFGKLVAYGIASIFMFHIFVNLGMIMGIMPVTGLPLLFMSYGGSSLLLSFIMLGIIQSIKVFREN